MVITRANIIGTITPTITGDTLTIMGITATHTSITATLLALGSALVFNSTNPKPGCFGSRNGKYSDEITKSNSNYSRERDDGRINLDHNSLDGSRTQTVGRRWHPARGRRHHVPCADVPSKCSGVADRRDCQTPCASRARGDRRHRNALRSTSTGSFFRALGAQ
jgi:hypothetical protein